MSNVDLSAALNSASSTTVTTEKQRKREKGLPRPELPAGVSKYANVVEVNPETHSMPSEREFTDPLFFWQSRAKYAAALAAFSEKMAEKLAAMPAEERDKERKQRIAAANAKRAANNDLVKEEFAKNPELLIKGLNAEQVAQLIAQLNAIAAAQAVQ